MGNTPTESKYIAHFAPGMNTNIRQPGYDYKQLSWKITVVNNYPEKKQQNKADCTRCDQSTQLAFVIWLVILPMEMYLKRSQI